MNDLCELCLEFAYEVVVVRQDFTTMYGPVQRYSLNGILVPWVLAFGCSAVQYSLNCRG